MNINFIFLNCQSLISLPDLSKWNIKNIKFMTSAFNNCVSLISLPDISNWKINAVNDTNISKSNIININHF